MLSNQTCYWGAGAPLHEKQGEGESESGGERVPPAEVDGVIMLW